MVEPRLGYARLVKVRAAADATGPARRLRSGRAPFDRRRYVLLCVVAAELLAVPVTTIGLLADRVASATARPTRCWPRSTLPAAPSAWRSSTCCGCWSLRCPRGRRRRDRRVRGLGEGQGALPGRRHPVDAAAGRAGRPVPARRRRSRRWPPRFEELLVAVVPGAALRQLDRPAQRAGRRVGGAAQSVAAASVFRRLVDDPVLYLDELTAEERAYLASPTGRQLLRRAAEQAGFVLEERAEGVLLVDPDGIATDGRFPDDAGTAKVAALLLLDRPCRAGDASSSWTSRRGGAAEPVPPMGEERTGATTAHGTLASTPSPCSPGSAWSERPTAARARPLPAASRYAVSAPGRPTTTPTAEDAGMTVTELRRPVPPVRAGDRRTPLGSAPSGHPQRLALLRRGTSSSTRAGCCCAAPTAAASPRRWSCCCPFLFDANLRANRLSTFGGSERTHALEPDGRGRIRHDPGRLRLAGVPVSRRTRSLVQLRRPAAGQHAHHHRASPTTSPPSCGSAARRARRWSTTRASR